MRKRILKRWTAATILSLAAGCAHKAKSAAPKPVVEVKNWSTTAPATPAPVSAPEPVATPAVLSNPAPAENAVAAPVTQPTTESTTEPAAAPATNPTTQASGAPPLAPAAPTTNPSEIAADEVLAESLCAIAQTSIPMRVENNELWEPTWLRVAAHLEAAAKLNPKESRFSRLLTDADLELHDVKRALVALNLTRKNAPDDQLAQIQFVDLTLGQLDTVESKIGYLKEVLGWKGSPFIPETVRAHAGVLAAQLYIDRGEDDIARNLLAEALRLDPVEVQGLRLRYAMLPPKTSHFERAEAIMALIRGNPDQVEFLGLLADQIAADGLVEESIPWYQAAISLGMKHGALDANVALRAASAMFIAGQNADAANFANQLTQLQPDNPLNWFLKLAVTHGGDKDQFNKTVQEARNAMGNRLVMIVDQIDSAAGGPQATTRPIDSDGPYPLPDLNVAILQSNQGNPLKNDFVTALFHLATVEIYFANQPDNASKLIDALALLLPKDNPDLVRVMGWRDLVSGKTDEAKAELSTIAANDPLAQLGLVQITAKDPGQRQIAQSMARKLITDYSSGVVGAILWDGMREMHATIVPSKEGDALKTELEQFPKDWLKILDQPQNFYSIHAEPIAISRDFGEPLLARVKITNIGNYDITVGADGILKPDLWFNADVKGLAEQSMPGTAFDRICGPVVLHSRGYTTQVVRLDQGQLKEFLASNPIIAMEIYGSLMTNPTMPGGRLQSAPGGYSVKFTRVFSRNAAPVSGAGPQQMLKALGSGTPDQKMTAINLLTAYVKILRSQKETSDQIKQAIESLTDAINKARAADNPAISAWAGYAMFTLTEAERPNIVRDLAADPDWRHRQIAGALLGVLPGDLQHEIALQLAGDPEPSVRDLGASWLEYNRIASTMPPAAPATQPADAVPVP